MNPQVKQVQLNSPLHPGAALGFTFSFMFKHPMYGHHPQKCPFNYLFALKPKNPV
jgi:hypothetical protein